jgi:tetratricopeptide (TPR) repeat protein
MSGTGHAGPAGHSGKRKIALLVLTLFALGTVFILPRFVSEPWIAGQSGETPATPAADPSYVSPSTAAEKTLHRQESQRVLAEFVAIRDRLLERNVESWAQVDFSRALKMVEAGDEQYSYGEYRASLDNYQQARKQLEALETLGEEKLRTALTDGFAAVEALNLPLAAASVEMAALIAPQDQDVQLLSARAGILPQLIERLEAGDQDRAAGRLGAAEAAYTEAVRLDSGHPVAKASLAAVRKEITDSRFRGHMSRGYAALDRGEFDLAEAAFRQAGTVYPGDPGIAQALAQVENRRSGRIVSQKLARAAALESGEQWHEAIAIYDSLLAEDPTLTDAKVRLIPARVRADLDTRLKGFIEDPLSLVNSRVYRAAQATLEDARGIPGPGEKLSAQISRLEAHLKAAVSSVNVVFQSDNLTKVTLYRVAELGQFEQTTLKLRPGRYIAAGTRQGFRDVRVEFTITGEPLDEPIVIRCIEPI